MEHLTWTSTDPFLAHVARGLEEHRLGGAARVAAAEETERRLVRRRRELTRVRFIESRRRIAGMHDVRIMSGRMELGTLRYAICPRREHGWVGKLSIAPDWHRGGLGRGAVAYLMREYPKAVWSTSGQFQHARGFWKQMDEETGAGWRSGSGACPHEWRPST